MTGSGTTKRFIRVWMWLFASALALYTVTLQRQCGWQDSGWFQCRAVVEPYVSGHFTSELGLALGHPGYIAVIRFAAQAFSGSPVEAINWVSALAMALAVSNTGYLVFRLTGARAYLPAVLAASMLAVSHVVWWLATIAEVYTCVAFFLTTELICLLSIWERPSLAKVGVLTFLAGLHWSFHNFALLALPVYGVAMAVMVVRRHLPPAALAVATLCFIAGAWPNVLLMAECAQEAGWWSALQSLLFGAYGHEVMGLKGVNLIAARNNLGLFALNFASPAWLLFPVGLWGCVTRERSPGRACVIAVLAVHAVFFSRYFVADQALFAVPTVTLMAVVAGAGAEVAMRRSAVGMGLAGVSLALCVSAPVAAYLGVNRLLHHPRLSVANRRELPFRDEARYWVLPWKHNERSAYQFKEAVLSQVEPDAIVVADGTAAVVLKLQTMLEPKRVGQRLFLENGKRGVSDAAGETRPLAGFYQANAGRPWYTVSPVRGYLAEFFLEGAFTFEKKGVLYRIHPDSGTKSGGRQGGL